MYISNQIYCICNLLHILQRCDASNVMAALSHKAKMQYLRNFQVRIGLLLYFSFTGHTCSGSWANAYCGFICSSEALAMSDEKRLIKHLLDNYSRVGVSGRPVFNTSDTVAATSRFSLLKIHRFDQQNSLFSVLGIITMVGGTFVSLKLIRSLKSTIK